MKTYKATVLSAPARHSRMKGPLIGASECDIRAAIEKRAKARKARKAKRKA